MLTPPGAKVGALRVRGEPGGLTTGAPRGEGPVAESRCRRRALSAAGREAGRAGQSGAARGAGGRGKPEGWLLGGDGGADPCAGEESERRSSGERSDRRGTWDGKE